MEKQAVSTEVLQRTPRPLIEAEIKERLKTMTIDEAERANRSGYNMVLMSGYISEAYREMWHTPKELQDIKS